MGIGCVLLMWTTGAIGGALIAFIGAFILTSGLRSKSGVRISIGGVLTSGGAITALVAIVFLVSWVIFGGGPRSSTSPAAFKSEFGFAPASDVRDIRSEMSDSTDSAIHYLRFRASPATIARITDRRFKPAPYAQCERAFRQTKTPQWWTPRDSACYAARPFDDSFAENEAWLAYDARSGVAYFYFTGVD